MILTNLGNGAGAAPRSKGVFARHQPKDMHPLPRRITVGETSAFGENRDGTEHITAAQADQSFHHRCDGPECGGSTNRAVEIRHAASWQAPTESCPIFNKIFEKFTQFHCF